MSSQNASVDGDSRRDSVNDISGGKPKKFLNGWTPEQEQLMAKWADIASCYRWLHDKAEKKYSRLNMSISIPVIILSTITGAANMAVGSFVPPTDTETTRYVGAGLGGLSIMAGIITTLGNFFQYAQKSESNRVASIAWGKFQRLLSVELAISPHDRLEAMEFLKFCRQDLDRLIEQSPAISDDVIRAFEHEFKSIPNLKVPDICHGIEHTRVFDMTKLRLGKVTAEAALHLRYKKNMLAKSVLPDIHNKVEEELNSRIEQRIRELIPNLVTREMSDYNITEGGANDWRRLLFDRRIKVNTDISGTDVPQDLAEEEVRIDILGETGVYAIPGSIGDQDKNIVVSSNDSTTK
jgi:hypothetical protein